MKTKIDQTDTKLQSCVTTIYTYDKYPLVLLEEIKGTDGRGKSYSSRRIKAKIPCHKYEYLKQLTLMQAKYTSPCELPYSIDRGDSGVYLEEDCVRWANDLAISHSKQNGFLWVSKEQFEEFEKDILAVDFRVYDQMKSEELTKKYSARPSPKSTLEIDAVAIEEER